VLLLLGQVFGTASSSAPNSGFLVDLRASLADLDAAVQLDQRQVLALRQELKRAEKSLAELYKDPGSAARPISRLAAIDWQAIRHASGEVGRTPYR